MAPIKLAIKDEHADHPFPVVKKNVRATEPPAEGEGLRLATYQGPLMCGDKAAIAFNLAKLEEWAAKAAAEGAQVLGVAELFLCGYNIRPGDRAESAVKLEEVMEMIVPIAKKNNIALLVPYAERVEGDPKMFDSMVLIDKNGTLLKNYRKSQLWGNNEKTVWRYPYVKNPEDAYTVVELNGIKVGMLNCYEAEFPELSRSLALKGAQVILIPTAADVGTFNAEKEEWSNWGYPDVARTCITTNAYHNKVFCAYINHSLYQFRSDGKTMSGIYLGNSTVADPMGQTMVIAENVETLLVVDCVPDAYPPTHPEGQSDFIKDRRPELFGALTSKNVVHNTMKAAYHYPRDPNEEDGALESAQ